MVIHTPTPISDTHTRTNICKDRTYLTAGEEKGSHWGLRREMMSNRHIPDNTKLERILEKIWEGRTQRRYGRREFPCSSYERKEDRQKL